MKGRIVENKIDDLKEYMDRVASLVRRYVPPDAESMQAAFQAGKASLDKASGSLAFKDYAKPGDKVTLTFDTTTRKLRSFGVSTYLDQPGDAVNLDARFSSLTDGTNFLQESVLDAKAREIQIKTVNFGHSKGGG